jgi:hypothetical protein
MKRVCRQITVGDFFKGLTLWEAGGEGDELEVFRPCYQNTGVLGELEWNCRVEEIREICQILNTADE